MDWRAGGRGVAAEIGVAPAAKAPDPLKASDHLPVWATLVLHHLGVTA